MVLVLLLLAEAAQTNSCKTPNISFIRADLSTVKCCIELADKIGNQTFDTVIFTIGMFSTKQLVRTSEGVPEPLSVNYLSRFVLVQKIIKRGLLVGRKRLYIFGYPGTGAEPLPITDLMLEHTPYENWPMQKTTVALNEALGYELVRRYPDITVVGVNPGFVTTDIMHPILGRTLVTVIGALFGISPETYAKSYFIHVVASEKIAAETRHTIVDQKGFEMPQQGWAKDEANSAEAWKQSQILVDRILESNKSTLNQ